jgi:putative transposase
VIASGQTARRVGSALLVVDGTDAVLDREAEFTICPNGPRRVRLERARRLSCEIYNAAIEHRRGTWRWEQRSVTLYEQFGELAELRKERPDIFVFGLQYVRGALGRADMAFSGFVERVKRGGKPGYPRFRSHKRYRTIAYDEPLSWAMRRLDGDRPVLYVQGVGEIKLPRSAVRQLKRLIGRGGEARTLTLTKSRHGEHWRACVGFRNVATKPLPAREEIGGVDRGVAVTAALPDGRLLETPPFLAEAREQIAALQRQRAGHKLHSPAWKRLNRKIAKAYS